jgi:outer membrane protein OmpA-like peptidoglycan-associated protein
MRQVVRLGVILPALMLLASGCLATRNWVNEQVSQKEVAIDQKTDQKVAGVDKRLTEENQRLDQKVAGVDGRLKTAEGTLGQTTETAKAARERADEAYTKADGANTKADETNSRLTRLWSNRNVRKEVETYQILFGFDKWEIGDNGQTTLAALVKEMRDNPKLTVDLQGYADPVGSYAHNVALSQRRVESVRRFLVEKGIELPRIHLVGLGPIAEKGMPNKDKRRVTVKMMVALDD